MKNLFLFILITSLLIVGCNKRENVANELQNQEAAATPVIISDAVTDLDGNCYNAIQIGHQLWMAENLRVTKDCEGNEIALGNEIHHKKPYRYNPAGIDSNVLEYGYLYNWEAARRACPKGWHLPTYDEWKELADYVGGQSQYRCEGKDWKIAKSLASKEMWESKDKASTVGNNPDGNNGTGFCALPAGRYTGEYDGVGKYAFFWNATENDRDFAYLCALHFDHAGLGHTFTYKNHGLSVRCMKDIVN